jgi:pilus assembly protein Flp/PilA
MPARFAKGGSRRPAAPALVPYTPEAIMQRPFMSKIRQFLRDESGPTTVEYAVMLALILLACISAVLSTGDVQQAMFVDTYIEMNEHMHP